MTYNSTELFVISIDGFDNPFSDIIYTDLNEAAALCELYNTGKSKNSASAATVMNLSDYYEHIDETASERVAWGYH